MPHTIPALLPHLADAAKEARVAGGLSLAHIAVHVRKRNGREGVSESTVARFEYGTHWPENPDAMIHAYNTALGLDNPCQIWITATALFCASTPECAHGEPAKRRRRRSANGDAAPDEARASARTR